MIFHPQARATLRDLPTEIRWQLGNAILQLQRGDMLSMPLSRPMRSIAPGAHEIRVRGVDGIYRAFYLLKSDVGVLVFHVFQKKSQKTPQHEIEIGRRRLRELLNG